MEENRKLKMIIGGLALVLLLGGGCLCLSFGWFASLISDDMDSEITNTRDGSEFGATRTSDECIREGYARTSQCSDVEVVCIGGAKDFLSACLSAVQQRDMSVCAGAPALPALLPDDAYASRVGERYGWDTDIDGPAGDIVSALEHWCALNGP